MTIPAEILAKIDEYATSLEATLLKDGNPESLVALYYFTQFVRGEISGGSGGGGATQAEIEAALESAANLANLATQLGTVGAVADVDGAITQQLRAIAESLAPTQPAPTAYRTSISVNDTLLAPTLGTATAQSGGSLTAVQHRVAVAAVNGYGRTTVTVPSGSPVTPSASGAIRIPITVAANATHYDIFLSTAADPLFVGRATAAQVTAGDTITAAATATTNATFSGTGTAGTIEVRVVGTGPAASTAAQNTAYVIPAGAVNCAGKDFVYFDVEVGLTTRWTEPLLTLVPFFTNSTASVGFAGEPIILSFGGAASGAIGSLRQRVAVNCSGNSGVSLLVQNFTGVGVINMWSSTR